MADAQTDRWADLRTALLATVDELYLHDLITSTGGNISVRLPETDHILITASRLSKGHLGPEHILEVDEQGRLVPTTHSTAGEVNLTSTCMSSQAGQRIRPPVEAGMHLAVYAARADVGAVIHTHAPLATVWGLFGEAVSPITLEAVRFTDMRTVPFAAPGSRELATSVAEALVRGSAALLRNHGLITVGKDLLEAADIALALEETLRIAFMAQLAGLAGLAGGRPAEIPPRAAEFLRKVLVG